MNNFAQQSAELHPYFDRIQKHAFAVGGVGLVILAAAALVDPHQFFRSYLLGFVYCMGLPLGSLAILMLHHLAGGTWGYAIRRLLEAASRTVPLVLVFFLPILLGAHELYEWTHAEVVAADPILTQKSAYLNLPFFTVRAAIYFAIWITLSHLLNKWSLQQDQTTETSPTRRMQVISGPGIILFMLTMTLAAVDWVMSLEPHWFSTIFSLIFIIGQGLLTWTFMTIVAVRLHERKPLSGLITNQRLRDLGTLTLAFVLLWTYTSFSQLLIIWSANLPEEITWYMTRLHGGWRILGVLLMIFHFGVPFLLLISSQLKAKVRVLTAIACGLIVMRLVDLYWITAPALHHSRLEPHLLDLVAPIALGGIFVGAFFWQLKKRSLVALNDPRFPDLIGKDHGHHHG
ncbi:MAG: hypothetical protein FJY95_20020 [Candidatus Handelsmanbacteria bacterium]|nr:hypothetical protein [Candidatus Handelsmanbacteria bacterium]